MLIIYHELLDLASINNKNLSLAIHFQNSFFYPNIGFSFFHDLNKIYEACTSTKSRQLV